MRIFGEKPKPEDVDGAAQSTETQEQALAEALKNAPAGSTITSRIGTTELVADPSSPLGQILPEHERLRNIVLENLRKESAARMAMLESARDQMVDTILEEERAEEHASGVENIQADFRAKKRIEMTGEVTSPGYVPPPDGGNSAIRFLQRLGFYDNKVNSDPILTEHEILAEKQRLAALAGDKTMSFANRGFSAPPAGQIIDTSVDNTIAVVTQMTQMFSPVPEGGNRSGSGRLIDALSGSLAGSANSSSQLAAVPEGITQGVSQGISQGNIQTSNIPAQSTQTTQPAIEPYPLTDETWDVTASMGSLSGSMQDAQGNQGDQATDETDDPIIDVLADIFGPQSRLAQQGKAVDGAPSDPQSPLASGGTWDVVEVKVAPMGAQMMADQMRMGFPVGTNAVRAKATPATPLVLGQSIALGKSPPTAFDPTAIGKSCINKHDSSVTFCIEQIDWPDELKGAIWVDTVMYQGLNAIVRYDNGVATRYHALFPSESFREVVEYYIAKLGPPHNTWNRTISPLASKKQANPTVSWKAVNPYTQVVVILEIRQFDDTRGGFPDEKRGAIMLHNAQSGTIFPQVSAF